MSKKIVIIGGSAGAISSINDILRALPADFPAAICVVVHMHAHTHSVLPDIFGKAGFLRSVSAEDGMALRKGTIFVAPPDRHMLVERGHIKLVRGPKENHHRPAIDPTFRSAAESFGPNVIAVLLSGYLDDGTAGLLSVKKNNGVVIVQDPKDTAYPDMPRNALTYVDADYVLKLSLIASHIELELRKESPASEDIIPDESQELAMVDMTSGGNLSHMLGESPHFSCPDCGGALWEIEEGNLVRYRCHEGHAFSPMSLVSGQSEALEQALWVALRTLDERAQLARNLKNRAKERGHNHAAERFASQAAKAHADAEVVRRVLERTMDDKT